MASNQLSLKISVPEHNLVKTVQFSPDTLAIDVCRTIRDKLSETTQGIRKDDPSQSKDFGLFLTDEDPKKGVWLENGRTLDYYMLRNGDVLEYKRKTRTLRVRMLDDTVKTVLVDDSQNVANLMVVICTKIGITNHDEYSLIRENQEEKENTHYFPGTLTLRRSNKDKNVDVKMEQLKKKLKTDDDLNWVDHSMTLREQGIGEDETLLLRRKFFFSDQNIDSRDPVQLNLLYVQTRDAIIAGTHPVTVEQACQFAGLQCQIQFGDHVESKHRPGFLDVKEFMPRDYAKMKGIEKKVFSSHMKHAGLSDLEAKVEYVKLARSLKTYGVTFFLVKEKKRRKNKLVPRLLGVTKDSVLRLDEKTKEILKTWPLTAVKRWAASPNSFTLDFGDYSDSYYSVQTSEGEQIAQLIAGYIDIILKRKKAKDHFGIDGDEGSTMVEDSVSPYKATIMQHQTTVKPVQAEMGSIALPAVLRAATNGPQTLVTKEMPPVHMPSIKDQAHVGHMAEQPTPKRPNIYAPTDRQGPQRALFTTMKTSFVTIEKVQRELGSNERSFPELGNDQGSLQWKRSQVDVKKQTLVSQLSAMNAATAKIITLTSVPEEDMDAPALGAAVSTITSNLPEMTKDVRVLASLIQDGGKSGRLIEAAKSLCSAFSDLLRAAEPGTKISRQSLLTAASRVGETSQSVLTTIHESSEEEYEYVDRDSAKSLLGIAKNVANTTANLVRKAKAVTSKCEEQDVAKVINSATQCALATSQLVACAKVVAPTIHNISCQTQLTEACKDVSRAVERVVHVCDTSVRDETVNKDLQEAATAVISALNDLLAHVRTVGAKKSVRIAENDGTVDTILEASDRLFSSTGDAGEMVRQARVLTQATTQLIVDIKSKAGTQQDSEIQRRLLAAAKVLADATNRLMEAAKGCASNPHDSESQAALKKAAEDLRNATNTAASNALRKKVISRLETSARQTTSAATQSIASIRGSTAYIENSFIREELETVSNEVSDSMTYVVQGIRGVQRNPDDSEKQSALIKSCEQFIEPASRLIDLSKSAIPHVSDQSYSIQMRNATQEMSETISELKITISKAQEACYSSFEIENAITMVKDLIEQVEEYKRASNRGSLRPLPGDNTEKCFSQLGSDCKNVGSLLSQLLTAASHGNEVHTGAAARDTINALGDLTRSIRGVLACSEDVEHRSRVLNSTVEVLEKSIGLFQETKWAFENLNDRERQTRLTSIAHSVSNALNNCVNCMPGQRDVDEAVKNIHESSQSFFSSMTVSGTTNGVGSSHEVHSKLSSAASKLNLTASEVVANSRSPTTLATAAKHYSSAFNNLSKYGLEMVASVKDQSIKTELLTELKSLSSASSKLLLSAKSVASDPHSPHAKSNLTAAARALSEAITSLLDVCNTAEAPGQKEVDSAIRNIQMMRPILDNPVEPVNNTSYFDCLDAIMEISRKLGDAMTAIGHNAERGEHDSFATSVKESASSICGLVENAAQAAYLVGAADPSSVAGRPGLVDINAFHKANDTIQAACQQLINRSSNQQQILSAATIIAKLTSSVCDSCRSASSKTTNPVVKRQFVQSARDVANATSVLVKEIKALDSDPESDSNRKNCATATRPLIEALESLITFASSSDFSGIPARISEKAKLAQLPIIKSGKMIIDNFCNMLTTAKLLSRNSKDPSGWASLASHSKNVSDSIKNLVLSIKEASPGQRECGQALEKLRKNIRELDQATFTLSNQTLRPRRDQPVKTLREMMHATLNEIGEKIDPVRITGKCEAENIGHTVTSLSSYFDPLVQTAINWAAKAGTTKLQMNLLDQTKTLCECALQLVYAVKECGGNPKASSVHNDIDDACEAFREAIQDLTHTLQSSSGETQVSGLIDSLTKSISRIEERYSFTSTELVHSSNFVDYQTRMVSNLREITKTAQEISSKSITQVDQLGPLVNNLSANYSSLASDTAGAIAVANNVDIAQRIRSSVQELGNACVHLTRATGVVQNDPSDASAQRNVADQSKNVSEKATFVLAALQAGSRGTQACLNAASTVSGIIGDLDTTIMFATAGTLNPENEGDVFSSYRDSILRSAKALVDDTKSLVVGAASNQEQLADAAQNAVTTIVQLSDTVKLGAASLGATNSEAQVLLLNAVKDVATALGELVQATKAASGKNSEDPAMLHLKESAKVMITNVTSLLKTVKLVEDEHQRGTRALEATIEAIGHEVRMFDSSDPPTRKCSPEDLCRATKPVTLATAKAVAAGTSAKQDDIIVAANMGRKAIYDLLVTTKQAAHGAESRELTDRILASGRVCAHKYRQLLELIHQCIQRSTGATPDEKHSLMEMSRSIASSVTEITSNAEMLKGSDWVDPDDPTVIAETELLGAASSIDAAAKKLASLQPRRTSVKIIDDDQGQQELNFDEMILDAAKSITAATAALVRAASAAQRELVNTGKVASRPVSTSDDGQWSEGLISGARHVAAATHSLVEAANALVQGYASEEKLISAAKQVASSTAQLLVACKVKADPDSKSMTRLQGAGNAVKRATDNLVKAAQQAIENEEEQSLVISKRRVSGIAQEILAREEILKKEKELTDAREKLAAIRKAKYNKEKTEATESYEYSMTATATATATYTSTTTSTHLNNSS